ncbi:hypothetical protein Sango_0377800 [Sesamum angolense]|uniref:Uncharacterized protein n=1 Tax=Sesamum angolense TaxID=2727404 RepID=A0AAE1XAQ6_9LAMI|nr:hypothetical protein Sango_0377800 [Sesamum angolense]
MWNTTRRYYHQYRDFEPCGRHNSLAGCITIVIDDGTHNSLHELVKKLMLISGADNLGSFDLPRHSSAPYELGGIFPVIKPQDAAVRALVHMLKTTSPLRQDIYVTTQLMQGSKLQTLRSCTPDTNETSEEPTLNLASSGLQLMHWRSADRNERLAAYAQ